MKLTLNYIILLLSLQACVTPQSKGRNLNVGVPSYWGELVPALQNTAYADAILSNQFDALVKVGAGGIIEPLSAISWTIDPEYKIFEFKIDTSKRFSNGKHLTASDFKKSWEYALSLTPKSHNSSLQDVLYRVEGHDVFDQTGEIAGLITPNDNTLIIRFKQPFRTALVYLSGSRMAVFNKSGNDIYGTGPYVLNSNSAKEAVFTPNTFSSDKGEFSKVIYEVVNPKDAVQLLESERIQLYIFAEKLNIQECNNTKSNISCYLGSISRHSTLILNGMKGKIFEKVNYRQALQSIIFNEFSKKNIPTSLANTLSIDPQLFLPFQSGRLSDFQTQEIVKSGQTLSKAFLKATLKKPLLVKTSETEKWVLEYLKNIGVSLHSNSGIISGEEIKNIYYKTYEADLLVLGLGVVSGDPDGVYHALGKNGSISSPMTYRKNLAKLLEDGRALLNEERIKEHYKLVSQAALSEVPFIHLGFLKTRMVYRSDIIKVKNNFKEREDDRLITFSPVK